jgi:restriction endonuclease S subunit
MRSNYNKLGQFIRDVSVKNQELNVELLLGVSITKKFFPSIANTVGTDMSKYKIVKCRQFAYGPVTSRNGEKISVALLTEDECLVSTSYTVFEIVDTELLDPEYLMMWFSRSEFDRYARYMSHGTVRELFGWAEMCDVELPVPPIEKQREIVREYNVVNDRITLNAQLTQKLEESAQAIYKQWFVDFEFPISKEYAESIGKAELEGKPYNSSGGKMVLCNEMEKDIPIGWVPRTLNDFVKDFSGGDWGKEYSQGNYVCGVKCIRGTDIPKARIGSLAKAPSRFILKNNLVNRSLKNGDVVVEISGGSPVQATGRPLLINSFILDSSECDLICSNFCKTIKVKDTLHSNYFYRHFIYSYHQGKMFIYENSTTGVKNFNLDSFLSQERLITPDNRIVEDFNRIMDVITKNSYLYGKEMGSLLENKNSFISEFFFKKRDF